MSTVRLRSSLSSDKATINSHGFKNYFSDYCLARAGGKATGTLGNVLIREPIRSAYLEWPIALKAFLKTNQKSRNNFKIFIKYILIPTVNVLMDLGLTARKQSQHQIKARLTVRKSSNQKRFVMYFVIFESQ